ncbi:MAG: ABC transporter substrate-binding protein [Trueperaceae bacterium]|nr:ABC transporter substrate-binding protein [Trueperaceae bacterium]
MRPHRSRPRLRALALALAFGSLATIGWAAPLGVAVAADLEALFELLTDAYADSATPPVRVDEGEHLVLRHGEPGWRHTGAVAVLPGVVLEIVADHDEAAPFMRFATSAAGQRILVSAGFLPDHVRVTDGAGRSFDVAQPVARLASPYGVATYLAYGVGAGDRIVLAGFLGARDPEGAAAMTRIDRRFPDLHAVTSQAAVNVETIAGAAPDVVFAAARSEWIGAVEALGIPVVVFDGESSEGLVAGMRLAGKIFGPDAAARAEAWISYYEHVLEKVDAATSGANARPSVLFTGTARTTVASGAMYQSALIAAAGGTSSTAALPGYWNEVGVEQVLLWNPEVILVPPYGGASVAAIEADAEWRLLDAVRAGRVLRVPKLVAPWDTPVPDSVLAVVWLAEVLHPGAVDLDCASEAAFFYRRFYDYQIGSEEVDVLCSP